VLPTALLAPLNVSSTADGASLTWLTVMSKLSVSVSVPPVPVWPPSSLVIENAAMPDAAAPGKFSVGVKLRLASALFMFVGEPVNVIALSLLPSPSVKVSPVSVVMESVPFVTERSISNAAASGSATEIELPAVKLSVVSSSIVAEGGVVLTGASLTWVIEIVLVAAAELSVPSVAVNEIVLLVGGASLVETKVTDRSAV
jgi:hypothetical protein